MEKSWNFSKIAPLNVVLWRWWAGYLALETHKLDLQNLGCTPHLVSIGFHPEEWFDKSI